MQHLSHDQPKDFHSERVQRGEGSTSKRKVKSLSPKRKTTKNRLSTPPMTVCIQNDDLSLSTKQSTSSRRRRTSTSKKMKRRSAPPTTLLIENDESSLNTKQSTCSSRRKRSSTSKKTKRRSAPTTNESSSRSKLEAMQEEEIIKLKSIQDKMEEYQANLEKEHRGFQRQIHAMELSHAVAETRTRALESDLEEAVEENEKLHYDRRRRISAQDENESEMELLRYENQILRGMLERCQLSWHRIAATLPSSDLEMAGT
ncbi:MAG: hypothetical protein SGBAC_007487 [Bacillariaceae sp.]